MLASETDLTGLKTKVGNLDVCKLKTVSARLSKLSNVVDDDVITKAVYDKLVAKARAIDTNILSTSELVAKAQYDLDKQGLEKKNHVVK